jgi:hypothetical protein
VYPSISELVSRFLPPWAQVVVYYYLAMVLMTWGMDKIRKRGGLLLAVIFMTAGTFFALQATFVLMTLL